VKGRKADRRIVDRYADAISKQDFAEAFANLKESARIALFSSPLSFYLLFLRRSRAQFSRVKINESKKNNREKTV
jgi:hypothetical protein